jgi:phosphoadenosine phosphosulfate reductase
VPVLFLDTGHLFEETVAYRDVLAERLGLTDVRTIRPHGTSLLESDPDNFLWSTDPDACCAIRKVAPLALSLEGFDAWINGRKRYQAATRLRLAVVEADGPRLKFNPLASWGRVEIEAHFAARALPRHPMESQGFPSIGCMPCTSRVMPGEDVRAGRWRGKGKVECGIHVK